MVLGVEFKGYDNVFGVDGLSIEVENGSVDLVVVGLLLKEVDSESLNGGGFG